MFFGIVKVSSECASFWHQWLPDVILPWKRWDAVLLELRLLSTFLCTAECSMQDPCVVQAVPFFLSCLSFVQLSESRAQSFVASFDVMCTCPHPAALRISVLFCFVVSLSPVPCCFTESAAEESGTSVYILFRWFILFCLKGEDAKENFLLGFVTFLRIIGCPLVLHTTVFILWLFQFYLYWMIEVCFFFSCQWGLQLL